MFPNKIKKEKKAPLYLQLAESIREDVRQGDLRPGEKLPSKRKTASDLGLSVVTVQKAYEQLLDEGYITSEEKRGYFVSEIEGEFLRTLPPGRKKTSRLTDPPAPAAPPLPRTPKIDLMQNVVSPDLFPLSVWLKLARSVYLEVGADLLKKAPGQGLLLLREAIANHLYRTHGMEVDPGSILIGSGNESMYAVLETLFGDEVVYGTENPGHAAVSRIYARHGARVEKICLDETGVPPEELEFRGVNILHVTPSHHFPTGMVTPLSRRIELLSWAYEKKDRFIVEDEYDSEFRMSGRPLTPLAMLDTKGRVVYVNTFTKTIAPSLRIGYAVLPPELIGLYRTKMGDLSCPVPVAEQYILARFIEGGYFERHIHRMRTYYRSIRDALLAAIAASPTASRAKISHSDSGLHFLLSFPGLSDETVREKMRRRGVGTLFLSDCTDPRPGKDASTSMVVCYAGLKKDDIPRLVKAIEDVFPSR